MVEKQPEKAPEKEPDKEVPPQQPKADTRPTPKFDSENRYTDALKGLLSKVYPDAKLDAIESTMELLDLALAAERLQQFGLTFDREEALRRIPKADAAPYTDPIDRVQYKGEWLPQ